MFAVPAYAQTSSPTLIPFEIKGGKIFASVTINGQPASAVIDSGQDYTGLDSFFASDAAIEPGRSTTLRTIHGQTSGRFTSAVAISFGPNRTVTTRMLVVDYGPLVASVLTPIEVVVGADVLSAFVVELDFDKRLMTLHDRTVFTPPAAAYVPLGLIAGHVVTAPVTVDGYSLDAIVDTGSESPLILSPRPARSARLLDGRPVSTTVIGGLAGASRGMIASAEALTLGPMTFHSTPVQVAARDIGAGGNLGLGVLSRFHTWLDLSGRRMWLAPGADRGPFKRNLIGFYGQTDDGVIRVSLVAKGSPAEAAGLKAGDVVTAINSQPAAAANRALVNASAGTAMTLTLSNGKVLPLTLGIYY